MGKNVWTGSKEISNGVLPAVGNTNLELEFDKRGMAGYELAKDP